MHDQIGRTPRERFVMEPNGAAYQATCRYEVNQEYNNNKKQKKSISSVYYNR
jgi:hypothetical protein